MMKPEGGSSRSPCSLSDVHAQQEIQAEHQSVKVNEKWVCRGSTVSESGVSVNSVVQQVQICCTDGLNTLIVLLQLMQLLFWQDNLRMQSEETDVPPPQHASLSALPIPPLFSIYPATCFSTCNMMATPSSISGSCFSAYTCTSATCVCPGNRGSPQPWLGKHKSAQWLRPSFHFLNALTGVLIKYWGWMKMEAKLSLPYFTTAPADHNFFV